MTLFFFFFAAFFASFACFFPSFDFANSYRNIDNGLNIHVIEFELMSINNDGACVCGMAEMVMHAHTIFASLFAFATFKSYTPQVAQCNFTGKAKCWWAG